MEATSATTSEAVPRSRPSSAPSNGFDGAKSAAFSCWARRAAEEGMVITSSMQGASRYAPTIACNNDQKNDINITWSQSVSADAVLRAPLPRREPVHRVESSLPASLQCHDFLLSRMQPRYTEFKSPAVPACNLRLRIAVTFPLRRAPAACWNSGACTSSQPLIA